MTNTRTLRLGDRGPAVKAAKRSVFKCLHTLRLHPSPTGVFGPYFVTTVKAAQKKLGIPQTGLVDDRTWQALDKTGCVDAYSKALLAKDTAMRPTVVYPTPAGGTCQGLHPTAGLVGNWAIDICAPPGTPVLAAEDGWVSRLSGHDPADDTWDSQGVYGWSVYLDTKAGYRYYITHLGARQVTAGMWVPAGTTLGKVGDQRFRPDHVHYGVTSPLGEADAKKRILKVSSAPRKALV